MKLVSVSLLIEALAARWNSDATPEMEQVADFIAEYAADSAFDIPLKTVLAHYDAEPDLFNPKAELPLTPGQYEALYNEDSASAFSWEPADNPALGRRVRAMGSQELNPTGRLRKSQPQLQEFPKAAVLKPVCLWGVNSGNPHVWAVLPGNSSPVLKRCNWCGVEVVA